MMNCIIVDDDWTALERTRNYISQVPYLKLSAEFRSPFDALQYINDNPVDLIFLDVHLREMSGIDLLNNIQQPVQSIIMSTYKSYAVEAFELNATDYMVKPVSQDRFMQACKKALKLFTFYQSITPVEPAFVVNANYQQIKIDYKRIVYIEAMKDYIRIHLSDDKPVTTHMTMKAAEEKLNQHGFVRIHKSFIININKVKSIHRASVQLDSLEIPCSTQYKARLNELLHSVH